MADPSASHAGYGHFDMDYRQHLSSVPVNDDGPIWIVSLMQLRDVKDAATSLQELARFVDAEVVLAGEVVAHCDGDGQPWNAVSVVKYPTRRSVAQLASDPAFKREQAIQRMNLHEAIMIGCIPSPTMPIPDGHVLPVWNAVPHPATDGDSPIVVLHAVRHSEADTCPEDMAAYARALAAASVPHGARGTRSFAVEGTIVGDGRQWDDVRLTTYPSFAAYQAVIDDLDHAAAYVQHRSHLIADQYTLVIRPTIDRLVRSLSHE